MKCFHVNKSGVQELLADHTPPVREIAQALRKLIQATVTCSEERVYWGWHAIGYTHPAAGYFGAIFPRAEIVKRCFEWVADLPDPDNVLTGNQKRIRYIEIDDECEIPGQSIVPLLGEALRFPLNQKEGKGEERWQD